MSESSVVFALVCAVWAGYLGAFFYLLSRPDPRTAMSIMRRHPVYWGLTHGLLFGLSAAMIWNNGYIGVAAGIGVCAAAQLRPVFRARRQT
ncbi:MULTISPECIES: hypothetical protein [Streptomyces]|uniref:hypothetical protein n=1 Tax=Streptomyces TaxID=1883 RepID=UPI000380D7B8|nr:MULTISPECIES: hypothetical protein [Streptomyces]QKV68805.1 hypothetical protein HUT13_08400 [Streptomyces harbinensis]